MQLGCLKGFNGLIYQEDKVTAGLTKRTETVGTCIFYIIFENLPASTNNSHYQAHN